MKRWAAAGLVVLGVSALACGFLKDEAEKKADITYTTEIPFDFEIDANKLCDPQASGGKCDGQSTDAPAKVELMPLETDLDVDIVKATGKEELREASSRFKKITITGVDWKVKDNDLTFDTPKLNIHMGPIPAKKTGDESVFKLTTIPSVDAGKDRSGTAEVSDSAEDKASKELKKLKMSVIPAGQPVIEKGQKLPPSGKATVEMVMHVKFVANPVTAAEK